jgi:uncharacterized DUF497 family protein
MKLEWNPAKERRNRAKHDVSFEEAKTLLESEIDYLELFDDVHSGHEERFISIGPVRRGLVVVVWTERTEETVRIISARFATKREKELYREHMEMP